LLWCPDQDSTEAWVIDGHRPDWSAPPTAAFIRMSESGAQPGDSNPRAVVLGSPYTQEIRMIWLLTALLVVALIVSSLRIGAWFLLKYDAGNRN